MSYCRKCEAKLDETARFCHVCGTLVMGDITVARSIAPKRGWSIYLLPVAILIAVLLSAIVISTLFFLSFIKSISCSLPSTSSVTYKRPFLSSDIDPPHYAF